MPDNIALYQYAVIRFVPKVEREEFFNIGLILFSKQARYIRMEYHLCREKFDLLCPTDADYDEIRTNLDMMKEIAHGNPAAGPIASLDISERFRWLTAVRSSVIQASLAHPGKSADLDMTFERLFEELVL